MRSRTQAAHQIEEGRIRRSRGTSTERILRASQTVRPGDVLTLRLGAKVLTIRVVEIADRRGPPARARGLYQELGDAGEVNAQ